jgi:hypothetical protein
MKPTKLVEPLPPNPNIHEFLAYHIDKSEFTQREIATACGFGRPSMISMIKSGDTRMPLERLGVMAAVLSLDLGELFKLWMKTYYPETLKALLHHAMKRQGTLGEVPGLSRHRAK